jgi:predicted O-methyltransferase YrrM
MIVYYSEQVASQNIAYYAGFASRVKLKVVVVPAINSLRKLQPEQAYNFMFIDADKPSNLDYFAEAKRLVKKGGVIVRAYGEHYAKQKC